MPRPSHSFRFYHPNNDCQQYRSLSSSLCSFLHSPVTTSLLGSNILLSTLFPNTISLRSSLDVSDQVSHPYKTFSYIHCWNISSKNYIEWVTEEVYWECIVKMYRRIPTTNVQISERLYQCQTSEKNCVIVVQIAKLGHCHFGCDTLEVVVESSANWFAFPLHSREVPVSSLDLETDQNFYWFSSVPPGKCRNNALKYANSKFDVVKLPIPYMFDNTCL